MNAAFIPTNNDDDIQFVDIPDGVGNLLQYLAERYVEMSGGKKIAPVGIVVDTKTQVVGERTYLMIRMYPTDWKATYCSDLVNNSLNCLNAQCLVLGDVFLLAKSGGSFIHLTKEALADIRGDFATLDMLTQFKRFTIDVKHVDDVLHDKADNVSDK